MHPQPIRIASAQALTALEKEFWLVGQERPNHLALSAEIDGRLPRERWRRAAASLGRTTPRLLAEIVVDQYGEPEFLPGCARLLPVRFVSEGADQWRAYFAVELAQPFLAEAPPLARVTVLEGESCSMLLVTAHRAVADERALAKWAGKLADEAGAGSSRDPR